MELEPNTEYVISDVYLPTMRGDARKRGDLRFRTDADGGIWIKGAGKREDACLASWYAQHPRLAKA